MLERLIGITRAEFDSVYRGHTAAKFQMADLTLRSVFTWTTLNRILEMSDRYSERISLVREGNRLDKRLFLIDVEGGVRRVDVAAVRRAVSEGFSILLDATHEYHRPSRDLIDSVAADLGERVSINVYTSWSADKCFLTHWDEHDVFIVQTEGAKIWTVYSPTRAAPLANDVSHDQSPEDLHLFWEGRLEAGEVLYIPRGWWHHAKSTAEGSIHLTLGFTGRTALSLMTFIATQACNEDAFRMDLPRPGAVEYETRSREVAEALRTFLDAKLSEGALEAFWQDHFARLPQRQTSHLPLSLDLDRFVAADPVISFVPLTPFVVLERTPTTLTLDLDSRRIELDAIAAPVIDLMIEGVPLTVQEVTDRVSGLLSPHQCRTLLFELLNEGLVVAEGGVAFSPEQLNDQQG